MYKSCFFHCMILVKSNTCFLMIISYVKGFCQLNITYQDLYNLRTTPAKDKISLIIIFWVLSKKIMQCWDRSYYIQSTQYCVIFLCSVFKISCSFFTFAGVVLLSKSQQLMFPSNVFIFLRVLSKNSEQKQQLVSSFPVLPEVAILCQIG